MAVILKDRVKVVSTTTGTGTFTLGAASVGFQSFAAIGDGNQTYYTIAMQPGGVDGDFEVGIGTVTDTAGVFTLSRDTVLESSNAGSAVNFPAGTKDVFVTYPAERAVFENAAGTAVTALDVITLGVTTANITTANITAGTVTTSPASGNDIVNKTYVDTLVASGIHFHEPVRVESPINLNATYNNGTAGVGATLTNAGTQVALVIDGITMVVADRVLVYEQTNQTQNGVYVVTSIGSGATNWVLTRSDDTDTYGVAGPDTLSEGSTFFVQEGATGAGETYTCNTVGTITFGTTNITFAQVSSAQIYSAGTGLTLSGTQFSITNTGTAGTYGSASQVPVFTTNAQGQVTSVTNTAIGITSAAVSGLAASATTDTTNAANITTGTLNTARLSGSYTGITGVGTLTAGTWNGSVIGAIYGGTGFGSYTVGDLLFADTSTSLAKLADVAVGNALISGGVGSAPSYGKIGLATHVSGTLPVANGGTGLTSLGAGVATFLGTPSSANLAAAVTDETGSGALVFATSPTFVTPALGTPSSGNLANCTFPTLNQNTTGSAATLTTGRTIAITGDLTYTSPTFNGSTNVTAAGTLATVNSNVGSFTNASVTVNGKGLVTAVSSGTAPVTAVSGTSPVVSSGGATPAISLSAGYGDTLNPYGSKTANTFLAAPNASAGVPTFRALVAADVPTLNQSTTGNAATATTLQTARTIGGVSFNGSANIDLPGVNTAGNQNTTGNADTATTATNLSGGTVAATTITATTSIMPVADNTGVVGDASFTWSNGHFTNLTVDSTLNVRAAIDLADNDILRFGSSDDWEFFHNGTDNYMDLNVGNLIVRDNTTTRFTFGRTTGNLTATTFTGALVGNATTATTLQTARTIGGVSFDGSANIDLPGVNTAGNQNTTGTAANVTGTVAVANGGTGQTTYTNGQLLIGNTTGNTLAKATLTAGTGITVTNGAGAITIAATNNGTVTSVGGTGTVSGLSLSGTVTTSGNLTLGGTLAVLPSNFASQTANTFLAAPNAAAGVPTFRTVVAADIPTLNQSTTGNAATATTLQTARTINGVSFNGSANITITAAATNVNTQLASLGVGTAASGTAGEIRATNNITAFFSDDRLKTRLGGIENALEKVRSLEGFFYEPNDVAQALGYDKTREVGVSAQQVQKVLPEIVVPAPIDDKYWTVRYEKLVPLLIEAIKELDNELQSIKAQLKD
jgi:hypothetical protein